jgi:hypothetical protein
MVKLGERVGSHAAALSELLPITVITEPLMILRPSRFLREPNEMRASDMVMVAYFAPPHAEEEARSVVRVGLRFVFETIGFLVVNPVQRVTGVQHVP